MMSTISLCLALLIHGINGISKAGSDLVSDQELRNKIEAGRQQLEVVLRDKDTDPECWRDSIMELMEDKCSALSYNSRSLTALKLTLCECNTVL